VVIAKGVAVKKLNKGMVQSVFNGMVYTGKKDQEHISSVNKTTNRYII